jgi:hypothetical protein
MWERKPKDRDAMWEVIRKKRTFTLKDIKLDTDHDSRTIKDFLNPLQIAGYIGVAKLAAGRHDQTVYKLLRDAGKQYPRLDKNGQPAPPSDTQRMWTVVKVIGRSAFDCRDLAFVAKTDHEMARKYCRFLERAGYLQVVQKESRKQLTKYRFVLTRDSGPRAPELRRRHTEVYDPNTRKVVWQKGGAK